LLVWRKVKENFFMFICYYKSMLIKNNYKFEWKIFLKSCEKFKNIILFTDYIKFDFQIFDYYVYFVLNIFFSISSFRIWFLY
jgi:hypothetical protein